MSLVTISQYTIQPSQQLSASDVLEIRGFYTRSFVAADGVTPIEGNFSNGQSGPYYSITPTLNGSGDLVVPNHDVQPTTESNPTGNYIEQLWVNGAFVQTILPNNNVTTGWQIPTTYGSVVAYDEIATYNRAKRLVYPPQTYFTADQTIAEIQRIAGDQRYATTLLPGIAKSSVDVAPASDVTFVETTDPRVQIPGSNGDVPIKSGSGWAASHLNQSGINLTGEYTNVGDDGSITLNTGTFKAGPIGGSMSAGAYLTVDGTQMAWGPDGDIPLVKFDSTGKITEYGQAAPGTGQTLVGSGGKLILSTIDVENITNVTSAPYNADNTGATTPYAGIAAAIASGAKRIYLPAGTYKFTQASVTAHAHLIDFSLGNANLEVFGDGQGKTIITVEAGVTWNASDTTIVNVQEGSAQSFHDITLQGPSSYVSGNVNVLTGGSTADKPNFFNFEITGWSGDGAAGANCVALAESYNTPDVSTTLGTAIVAGTRTVTPASMNSIYKGRRLIIGGTTETIIVTNVTTATFTAVFANNHGSSDSVTGYVNSFQGAIIEKFNIHDNPKATALVVNSAGNKIRAGNIKRIGTATTQHGLYVQAGRNRFEDIWIEGIYGYSIHQFPTGGGVTDSSGNVYDTVRSTDPGTSHILIDYEYYDDTSSGSNPYYPTGTGLSRYTNVVNCLFKNTQTTFDPTFSLLGPVFMDNCVLEDINATIDIRNPASIVTESNVSRPVFRTSVSRLPVMSGGGIEFADINPSGRMIAGRNAYPGASVNTTGGNLEIVPGVGRRKFTAVSNTAGAVAVTLTNNDGLSFTLTSGVDFTLGSDNSGTQLNVTARNLADAINVGTNANRVGQAVAVNADIYVFKLGVAKLGDVVPSLTLSTNQSGRISATNGEDGIVRLWKPQVIACAFASLPASPVRGMLAIVTDSNTVTWGATIAGGGTDTVQAFYNGSNWTVTGK